MHQVRYAHCEGYTDICWTDKGSFLTTGEDGDVRIWQGFDDLDNTSVRVSDKCFAVAYKNGKIYVADDLNEVKKYDLESNELQGKFGCEEISRFYSYLKILQLKLFYILSNLIKKIIYESVHNNKNHA